MGKLNVKVVINCGGSSSGGSSGGNSGGSGDSGSGGNGGSGGTTETKYTIQIGSVTPTSERTTIQYGIWNNSTSNYVYNSINVGESFEVPKDTNWVVQVETEYSDSEKNYRTEIINGRNEDKVLNIVLEEVSLKKISIVDGNDKIDDLEWFHTENATPYPDLKSPSDYTVVEEGLGFILFGTKSGYKTFFVCNEAEVNANINSTVNLTSLGENTLDVTLIKEGGWYPTSLVGNRIVGTRYTNPKGTSYYINFLLLIDNSGGLKIKVDDNISIRQIKQFNNNARLLSVTVDLQTLNPTDGKIGEIDIYKVSGSSFTITNEEVVDGITSRHFDIYSQGGEE